MSKWSKCNDQIFWTDESNGFSVKLFGEGIKLAECFPNLKERFESNLVSIADVIVLEWKEIWVQVEGCEVEEIRFGSEIAQKHRNEWRFTFRNYLGKSFIHLRLSDGREIVTDPIEVVSPKTLNNASLLFYPKLLRALVDCLIRYLVTLPFDWSAPTEFMTEERIQPPSPIFVLHVLAQNANKIRFALQTILRNPHRRLVTEERWVRLDEVSSVDADTILMMLRHPEYLHPYRGNSLTVLAQKLKGKAPTRVFERRVTETLDTPENRFIKRFMEIVLFWCDKLEQLGYWQRATTHAQQLNDLRNFVRFVRADPLFADVSEMEIFPASSQVLLKRDGYRECLQIYRLLHLARSPIFDRIQDAIDNRRIDQLYEFWCFFKLAEKLAKGKKFTFKPTLQPNAEGLEWGLEVHFDKRRLIYNKQFGHGEGSYSVPLRPDFSLFCGNELRTVFDAKFRFDEEDVKRLNKETVEQAMEEASQKGDIELLAKHADICKMHTYRDALQCRAAVVLYPGKESVFFRTDSKPMKSKFTLDQIAFKENLQGVGAISFVPKNLSKKRAKKP